jgi:hypothetical protein
MALVERDALAVAAVVAVAEAVAIARAAHRTNQVGNHKVVLTSAEPAKRPTRNASFTRA